jgi:hypothetical protein
MGQVRAVGGYKVYYFTCAVYIVLSSTGQGFRIERAFSALHDSTANGFNQVMERFRKIRLVLDKHIDYPAAIAGACVLGSIVFAINYDHGWNNALVAATKQATYTFFAGGFMVRLNERIALALNPAVIAVPAGMLCAGALAVSLTYLVHSLRGTPEPLNSTLPTLLLLVPGFIFLGIRARSKMHRPGTQEK